MTTTARTRRPNLVFLVTGGFIVFFIMKLIWWWIAGPTTDEPQKVSHPAKETSTTATNELGKLWQTLDWNSVTPGKALAEYVGSQWVNWILWPIMALVIFLIARTVYRTFFVKVTDKKKSGDASAVLGWAAAIVMIVAATAVTTHFYTKEKLPGSVNVTFPFPGHDRTTLVKTAGYETVFEVAFPRGRPNTGLVWGICPKVTKPVAHPVPIRFTWTYPSGGYQVNPLRFSEETKERLLKAGMIGQPVEVTFQLVEVPGGTSDVCSYLAANPK